MKSLRNLFIALAALSLVGACSSVDIAKTRALPSKGTAFQKALHMEYAQLAFEEDDEGDDDNAVYFDKKAVMAAAGKNVQPDTLKDRKIPAANAAELEAARIGLIAALGSGGRDRAPKPSAHAQAMFDCWMEEQEENFQPKDIARCRLAFDKALADIDKALAMARPAPMPAAMPSALPRSYVVYFATDSARLDSAAMAVVKQAVADAKAHGAKKVMVTGHTDTRGSNAYNMTLSDKRTDAVAIEMVSRGVSGKAVKKARYGETRPAVASGDNKNEPKNRRVSITLSK